MASNKHTLCFDGNHFLFKTLFVLPRTGPKLLDEPGDRVVYLNKLSMDFAAEIRKFKSLVDRIVFTVDSKSWRRDFYPEADYKGNRSPSEDVNWDNFYKIIDEFQKIIADKGIIIQRTPGAEGDDLVFAWSKYLNLKGDNCIIISGDRDLIQLVNYNKSMETYTLFYTNTQKRFISYPGFSEWLNASSDTNESTISIFDMKSMIIDNFESKTTFKSIIDNNSLKHEEINSDSFGFKKVLMGDKGDNVMPAYYYKKNTRTYGVSEKKAEKVLAAFEEKHGPFKSIYFFEKSYKEDICRILIHELNAKHMTYSEILKNIEDNIMLMLLHQKSIPEEIQNDMLKSIEENYKHVIKDMNLLANKSTILKGTGIEGAKYTPKSYDFFKNDNDKGNDNMDFIIKKSDINKLF